MRYSFHWGGIPFEALISRSGFASAPPLKRVKRTDFFKEAMMTRLHRVREENIVLKGF